MTIIKGVDWKSLDGKTLKIYVAEPNEAVIGVDEETGKSYMLKQEQRMFMNIATASEPVKKRGLW